MPISAVELASLVLRPSSDDSLDLIDTGACGRVIPVYEGSAENERPDRFEVELSAEAPGPACRQALEQVRDQEGTFEVAMSVRGGEKDVTVPVRLQEESFMTSSTPMLSFLSSPGGGEEATQRLEIIDRAARDVLATLMRE